MADDFRDIPSGQASPPATPPEASARLLSELQQAAGLPQALSAPDLSQYIRPYSADVVYPGSASLPIDQQHHIPEGDANNFINRRDSFDNPFTHLEHAKQLMHEGGVRAAEPEYFAAIHAADSINQQEVARERREVRILINQETNPHRRRELVQEDCLLHDLQRMPGAARANLAFAYLVTGHQLEGTRLMLEAARLDPEMTSDPNFIRHFRSLECIQPPPAAARTGQIQDNHAGQPNPTPVPVADRTGAGTSPATAPEGGQGQYVARAPEGTVRGDGTRVIRAPGSQTIVRPAADIVYLPPPSGNNYVGTDAFADPLAELAAALQAFDKAGKKLTPEIVAMFLKAIKDADHVDRSSDAQDTKSIDALEKRLAAQLGDLKPENIPDKIKALTDEQSKLVDKLPQAQQDQLAALVKQLATVKTAADYNKIVTQMSQISPEIATKQKEIDKLSDCLSMLRELEMLRNSHILTRMSYEEALRSSGQTRAAKEVLQETLRYDKDKTLSQDDTVKAAAQALGVNLNTGEQQSTNTTDQTTAPSTGDTTRQQQGVSDTTAHGGTDAHDKPDAGSTLQNSSGSDAMDLLAQAQHSLQQSGFNDSTKKLFQEAIKSADELKTNQEAQALIDQKIKSFTESQQKAHAAGDKDSEKKASDALQLWNSYKSLPTLSRFLYAQEQYKSGDQAGAKTTMSEALAKDPDLSKDALFQAYNNVMQSGKPLTEDNLNAAASQQGTPAGQQDNPINIFIGHYRQAEELTNQHQFASAEKEWKAAIEAADKLPLDQIKAKVADLEKQRASESDPKKTQDLTDQIDQCKNLLQMPVAVREETSLFYASNNKGDEAHALLAQAAKLDPNVIHTDDYKNCMEKADYASKGTVSKWLDKAKDTAKDLLIDGGAGATGLTTKTIVENLLPEGKLAKLLALGVGMSAGGAADYGLSKYAFHRQADLGNVAWGAVDTLAFLSGSEVKQRLTAAFDKNLPTERLANRVLGQDAVLAEKNAAQTIPLLDKVLDKETLGASEKTLLQSTLTKSWSTEEKGALEAAMNGTASDAQKAMLDSKSKAMEAVLQSTGDHRAEIIAQLENGKGLRGAAQASSILERELAEKRSLALKKTLDDHFAEARAQYLDKWRDKPVFNWKKPWQSAQRLLESGSIQRTALELQARTPFAWRVGETLTPFRAAQNEYLTARSGSILRWALPPIGDRLVNYMPWNGFLGLESAGSLRALEGRLFWRRFGVDAATAGAAGAVLEGTHNAQDWYTGQKTAGQAAWDFAKGTLKDAGAGGAIMWGFHGLDTGASKVLGDGQPLTAPKPLTAESSIWSRTAQPFRYASYYGKSFFKAPEAYDPPTAAGKAIRSAASRFRSKVAEPITGLGERISTYKPLKGTASALGAGLSAYSSQIQGLLDAHSQAQQDEAILANLQENDKPLTDESPETPAAANPEQPQPAPAVTPQTTADHGDSRTDTHTQSPSPPASAATGKSATTDAENLLPES